ncbi:unnamed protein product, partial [Haemonchus placei]|uniref:E3 ubiquitin-protein ligase n=1 Tax=Haemonchus placei TaxID=6290 RepID=A0A0N4WIW1_HAEPC
STATAGSCLVHRRRSFASFIPTRTRLTTTSAQTIRHFRASSSQYGAAIYGNIAGDLNDKMAEDSDDECPVCAQKMILPTTVPGCGHKFCFLCIKGKFMCAVFRTNEHLCPMCRGEVSTSIFRNPAIRGISLDMARTYSDEAGPSTSSKKREQSHEQESESCQKVPNSEVACGDGRYYWLYEVNFFRYHNAKSRKGTGQDSFPLQSLSLLKLPDESSGFPPSPNL